MAGAIFPKSRGGPGGPLGPAGSGREEFDQVITETLSIVTYGSDGRWNALGNTIGHPPKEPKSGKHQVLGKEIVELRSPDLRGVPFDAEFHARFAHEGPKAARTQFKG